MTEKPIIAAFDFDSTLTICDSLFPFLFFVEGPFKTCFMLITLLPQFLRFKLGSQSRQQTKEAILTKFFKGSKSLALKVEAERYSHTLLNKLLVPKAMDRLLWHASQGHRCVIVSASIDLYLIPWANQYPIETVLGSKLEVDSEGIVTGRLMGKNCWGQEKVERLKNYLESLKDYTLYAYGDSRGDEELLAAADFPFYQTFS